MTRNVVRGCVPRLVSASLMKVISTIKVFHVIRLNARVWMGRFALTKLGATWSAMLMALADLEKTERCEGVYRVFDGRRRSELHLKDFGTTTLKADKDWAYEGQASICGSASKMIGGHKIKKNGDDDEEMDFEKVQIFVARPDGKTLMPVRIELNSFLGSVIARLNMATSVFN